MPKKIAVAILIILAIVGGLILLQESCRAETSSFRERCTRDRCAIYSSDGRRIGSASRDDTGRTIIRDFPQGRTVAKVVRSHGITRIERVGR